MSVTNKEKNFISAVVYLHNDGAQAVRFFKALNAVLDRHFEQYELVAVDDACADDTIPTLRDWAKALEKPLTILHLSLHQGRETAMNAGLDAAIGDYVYEFDSTQTPYPIELVFEAYRAAMAGSDIVSVCPRSTAGSSKMFYRVFNGNSHRLTSCAPMRSAWSAAAPSTVCMLPVKRCPTAKRPMRHPA